MKAFEEVWSLIKMPAKGWECPECKMPMMVQVDSQSLQCMNCHAVALTPARKARNSFDADSAEHQGRLFTTQSTGKPPRFERNGLT